VVPAIILKKKNSWKKSWSLGFVHSFPLGQSHVHQTLLLTFMMTRKEWIKENTLHVFHKESGLYCWLVNARSVIIFPVSGLKKLEKLKDRKLLWATLIRLWLKIYSVVEIYELKYRIDRLKISPPQWRRFSLLFYAEHILVMASNDSY